MRVVPGQEQSIQAGPAFTRRFAAVFSILLESLQRLGFQV